MKKGKKFKNNMVSTKLSSSLFPSFSTSLSQQSPMEPNPPHLWGSLDHMRGHMWMFQPTTPASISDDR